MSVCNDVWFRVVMPKCGLRELLVLRGVNWKFYEAATDVIDKSVSAEDIYGHCSPEFIIKFDEDKTSKAYFILLHRLGRIEPQLIEYIIDELGESAATSIIRNQKLDSEQLRLFIERCRYRFSPEIMHEINFCQHITPGQLNEFQDVMAYTTIHQQKHLHPYLHKLRKSCEECEFYTKWQHITTHHNIEIYIPTILLTICAIRILFR